MAPLHKPAEELRRNLLRRQSLVPVPFRTEIFAEDALESTAKEEVSSTGRRAAKESGGLGVVQRRAGGLPGRCSGRGDACGRCRAPPEVRMADPTRRGNII